MVLGQATHLTGTSTLARSQKPCMNLLKAGLAAFSSSSSWSDPSMSSWPPLSSSSPELLVLLSSIGSRAFSVTSIASSEVMTAVDLQLLAQINTSTNGKQGVVCTRLLRVEGSVLVMPDGDGSSPARHARRN